LLRLNQRDKRFLAIQLGVKKTSFVTLPPGTNEEDQWMFDLQTPDNINDLEKVLETAARRIKVDSLWGVLVSVPGIVDENEGKVIFSPNLHWTENANLQVLIKNVWKAEALLMQEERALALGHHVVDAKGEDFFLVDFGEGIGGAAMVGGRLYSSSLPLSGELGHTPVCGNKRKCGCGATGCIETLVSERGLIESFSNIIHNKNANWKDLVEHIKEHGLEPWLVDTLNATASVIAEALNVMGIRRVVMTGFISSLPKPVSDYLKEKIADGAMWARFGEVDVEIAPRRRTAGLVAAGIDKLVIPLHIKEK
jgi:predicted NBD/HSP70 family sugar kinase